MIETAKENHDRLLHNCYKALKFGGVIRFNFAGDGNCSNFHEVVQEVMNYPGYKMDFNNFVWPWFMPRISEIWLNGLTNLLLFRF